MSTTIDPRFMTAVNWAAQTTTLLAPYGTVQKLTSDDRWLEWARGVVALPAVAALGCPRPEPYANWQDWARQFNMTARLLTV